MKIKTVTSTADFMKAYDCYCDAIFRYSFWKIRSKEAASDIAQDTFLRAWKYLTEHGTIDNIQPFLYKVASRLIIDQGRKRKSQSLDAMFEEKGFDITDTSTVDLFNARSTSMEGARALEKINALSPRYRNIIYLRFVVGLGTKEISIMTEESRNVVSVRLNRAIKTLRKLVEDEQEKSLQ